MPLDYFLWGDVKTHVYTDKAASIDALEDNTEAFIHEIPVEMLERVCKNWTKRKKQLKRSRSQYSHEIIFKHLDILTDYMDRFVIHLLPDPS